MSALGRGGRAAALLVVTATTACGVPTGGSPVPIPASDVPYGLASPLPTTSAAPSSPARLDEPSVYLTTEDGALVPRGRSLGTGALPDRLDQLLDDLAVGPSPAELTGGLSTALRPDVSLGVAGISGATVTIDLGGSADAPTGRESKAAAAQIVLTATSLPGVDEVLLTRAGEQVDAPLPSGQLTSRALSADDYTPLLTPPAAPSS